MGSCWADLWRAKTAAVEYSISYDPGLMEPLISRSDFLMRDSVIEAQFGDDEPIVGQLSFSDDDGGHA